MKFPWNKYKELPVVRRNTLQIFITNDCNLRCYGCFARNIMGDDKSYMTLEEYKKVVDDSLIKGVERITLIGGEPFMHPDLDKMIRYNNAHLLKTTIYTNGYYLEKYINPLAKLRISLYCKSGKMKSIDRLPKTETEIDVCFMVSRTTTVDELLETSSLLESDYFCGVFFISSLRELDNPNQEFFDDTDLSMPVMEYKKLVHDFLDRYEGKMEIHVSKRGVFESTVDLNVNKCKFANYFIGGKIIQCPYDIVNQKFQSNYEFDNRYCQHNSTCLMSKVIYKRNESI